MTRFRDAVRVATPETAVWRICEVCGLLAALPPDLAVCHVCQPAADADQRPRKEER